MKKLVFPARSSAIWLWLVTVLVAVGAALCLLFLSEHGPASAVRKPPEAPPSVVSAPPRAAWKTRIDSASAGSFSGLLREVVALPPSDERNRAIAALLSRWISADPAGFRMFLDEIGMEDADGNAFPGAFFAAVAEALPYVTDRAAESGYLAELAQKLVEFQGATDPERALEWADRWLLGDALDVARVSVIGSLAHENFERALGEVDRIAGPLRRLQALTELGTALAQDDPPAAVRWARALPHDTERAMAMNSILSEIATSDPDQALTEFRSLTGELNDRYQKALALQRQARGLPPVPPRDASGRPIVEDAGGEDLPPSESPDLDLLADAARIIAREIAVQNPARALDWIAQMPESVLKNDSLFAALGAWAESRPDEAFAYYRQNAWWNADAAADIFSRWAAANPAAATAVVAQVSSPAHRQRAIEGVVEGWTEHGGSVQEISAWAASLPSRAERDLASRALAESLDGEQPEEAWRTATRIADAKMRWAALKSSFTTMAATEPQNARKALADAPNLTGEERRDLAAILAAAAP